MAYKSALEPITIQAIMRSYQRLGDSDPDVRDQANLYLYSLIDHEQVWIIAKEMIVNPIAADFQLLGAQILYQKIERDICELHHAQLNQLKQFVFMQMINEKLNFATVRKLASVAALLAIWLMLDAWPSFFVDMIGFMEASVVQLKSGLAVFQRLPEQLKQNSRVKHNVKMQIRQKLIQNSDLLCRVYSSTILLNQPFLTEIALSGLESWIFVGFPLLKYAELIQLLIKLFNCGDQYLQSCCRILKEGLKYAAREKHQSISQSQFSIQREKYSNTQIQSLKQIVEYIQGTREVIYASVKRGNNSQQIQIYTSIIKQMLLSYGFILKQDFGYQLIEMLFKVLESSDLKLSYSTFQFWIQFCDRIEKMKVEQALQLKFWSIVEHLLDVILERTLLDNDTLYYQLLKQEDTLDDITKISLTEYRKQAQNIIKFTFDYFSTKKNKEGSTLFFQKLFLIIQNFKNKGEMPRGIQLAVYAVKATQQSIVKDYDIQNMVSFISFVMNQLEENPHPPIRLIAEVLNLLKDCNREVKQTQSLFMKCLGFCLKYVSDDNISHYAVYAFQSLMQSINELGNDSLVSDLMNFYSQTTFKKDTVLEKVLQGIMTTITKLTNREAIKHYLMTMVASVQAKNQSLSATDSSTLDQTFYQSLIQIKTLLDSFDHFKAADQQHFRPTFLRVSSYGIIITTKIIRHYISHRAKFTTVGELGMSLGLLRNALKICENTKVEFLPLENYISLLNIVISIIASQGIQLFNQYQNLLDIICKVLSQFVGQKISIIDNWVISNLPIINSFFMNHIQSSTMLSIDPDLLKWYFAIQQNVLLYSRDIYLLQQEHQQIYDLAVSSVRFINERTMQRRAINYLLQCVQMQDVYLEKIEITIKALFACIPIMSNLCHINLGRMLVILLQKTDQKAKENIFRQLLQFQPYKEVNNDLKEVIAKLFAFSVQTKIDRYIKGAISDLTEAKTKQSGSDLALHLELRFASWKKEYKKMGKGGSSITQ